MPPDQTLSVRGRVLKQNFLHPVPGPCVPSCMQRKNNSRKVLKKTPQTWMNKVYFVITVSALVRYYLSVLYEYHICSNVIPRVCGFQCALEGRGFSSRGGYYIKGGGRIRHSCRLKGDFYPKREFTIKQICYSFPGEKNIHQCPPAPSAFPRHLLGFSSWRTFISNSVRQHRCSVAI